ncbi:MAG: endolytic transglycosylase MltG [Gaiellaceae bacterium]
MGAPPKAQVARRRVVALVVLVAGLGLLGWLGVALVRGDDASETGSPETRPTTATAQQVLRIVFPEGFTREEMADRIVAVKDIARRERGANTRLSRADYLSLTASASLPGRFARDAKRRTLEGFLFPATYAFTPRTTTEQLVALQLKAFRANWAKVDLRYARSKNLTPYDVLVIASMIEKEVVAPDERALVSSVIYNRLKRQMTLGIDATIRYALKVPATESLRQSHLDAPTPYNTRIHAGLPPGPIANPGLASMQAAAHPKKTNYLYFVRKPDRQHHFFTASKQEFDEYQLENGY